MKKFFKFIGFIFGLFICHNSFSQTFAITPEPSETRSIEKEFSLIERVRGEIGIWYKFNECNRIDNIPHNSLITKPFIICEGFDLTGEIDLKTSYEQLNSGGLFLENLRSDGYDIIILNLRDNEKEMQKNAKLLKQLIEDINAEVILNHQNHNTFIYRPIVLGISMGGLISRYALCDLEEDGKDVVEKLICWDSPHKGANIPLGLQHMANTFCSPQIALNEVRSNLPNFIEDYLDPVKFMGDLFGSTTVGKLFNLTNNEAALQLCADYITTNTKRIEFLSDINDKGKYPKKCHKLIGVAMGSNGTYQEDMQAGDLIFNMEGPNICFVDRTIDLPFDLGSLYFRFCPFTMGQKVWAMPGNDLGAVSSFHMGTEFDINSTMVTTQLPFFYFQRDLVNAPLNKDFNIDHVPGSTQSILTDFQLQDVIDQIEGKGISVNLHYDIDNVCDPLGVLGCTTINIVDLHWDYYPFGQITCKDRFCFVPTVSALDFNTDDWNYDVSSLGHYPKDKDKTPFDVVYWHSSNAVHAWMDAPLIAAATNTTPTIRDYSMNHFIMEEISPVDLFIQNRTFASGYQNTFEARGYISVGRNVDLVPGRTDVGDVVMENGSDIVFSVGQSNFVYFDNGFDSNNGNFQVVYNVKNDCDRINARELIGSSTIQQDDVSGTYNPDPTWNTLRRGVSDPQINNMFEGQQKFQDGNTNSNQANSGNIDASAFPNPFSESTKITYVLGKECKVSLSISNSLGEEIAQILKNRTHVKGQYEIDFSATSLPDGVYILTFIIDGQRVIKKLVVAK